MGNTQSYLQKTKRNLEESMRKLEEAERIRQETKRWNVIKWIPGVNIVYGFLRFNYYARKNESKPAIDSVIVVSGEILGLLAGGWAGDRIAGATSQISSQFLAAFIHFAFVRIASGIAQNVVIGAGDVFLISIFETEKLKTLSRDKLETLLYDKIFKDIPIVGALYSLPRGVIYAIKDDDKESARSFWASGANAAGSIVGLLSATAAHHFTPQAFAFTISSYEDNTVRGAAYFTQKVLTGLGILFGAGTKKGLEKLGDMIEAKYLFKW